MADRYYIAEKVTNERVALSGAEAHHLLHVMRASVGDAVTLFDGSGWEFAAEVVKLARTEVLLNIVAREQIDRELPFSLTVGVALPKGDRQKWLVEKLTELGVARLVPLATEHSVAQPTDKALERLHRTVIEACKQCGRNRLMQIASATAWSAFVAERPAAETCLLAHPAVTPERTWNPVAEGNISIAIGPEGGFTDDEFAQATNHSWQTINLGQRILRVETAAVALVGAIVVPG